MKQNGTQTSLLLKEKRRTSCATSCARATKYAAASRCFSELCQQDEIACGPCLPLQGSQGSAFVYCNQRISAIIWMLVSAVADSCGAYGAGRLPPYFLSNLAPILCASQRGGTFEAWKGEVSLRKRWSEENTQKWEIKCNRWIVKIKTSQLLFLDHQLLTKSLSRKFQFHPTLLQHRVLSL